MSLLKKLADTITFFVEEGVEVTRVEPEEQKLRIVICETCENFTKTRQCTVCKCFMDVKTNLLYDPVRSLSSAKKELTVCPKGLW